MKCLLKGKIMESSVVNGNYFTNIAQPSVDEFAQPSMFRVMSQVTLGAINDLVQLQVSFSGYIKNRPYKDKTTGENKVYVDQVLYMKAEPYLGTSKTN
jgi:hypothetical protein